MLRPQIQFGTKSFFGVISFIAIAFAALRNVFEAMQSSATIDGVRFVASVCVGCGCCFGIAGIVVGYPGRGFLFGLVVGALANLALFLLA